MPLIPTYRAGVGAPQLADAYLGARRIAQEAASDAARISLGREQLAQQAVQAEMELSAKREALTNEALRRQQEQEIDRAYKQTQIGLEQRKLANEEAFNTMRIKQAQADFDAQANVQRAIEGGMPPDMAMRRFGTGLPGFASSLGSQGAPLRDTASDRRLRYDILKQQLEEVDAKYGKLRGTPEYNQEIDKINTQIRSLLNVPGGVGSTTTQSPRVSNLPPPPIQQYGPPVPSMSVFMGTPPAPKMDTSSLAVPSGLQSQPASTLPQPGQIVKGYRFKGGNPSMRANWEKVK